MRLVWTFMTLACASCSFPSGPNPNMGADQGMGLPDQTVEGTMDLLRLEPDLLGQPDLRACPSYVPGGGGGMNRPQVLIMGGKGQVGNVTTTVKDFFMDVFLITVGAYRDCVTAGVCTKPFPVNAACQWTDAVGGKENNPLDCMGFQQAKDFCQWTQRRVPTEAEWSYAAGEGRSIYPWGNDDPQGGVGAQLCPQKNSPCPVGLYFKSLNGARDCGGLADLAGDATQWLDTEFKVPFVQSECTSTCSLRGGSSYDNTNTVYRSDNRSSIPLDNSNVGRGFRCANSVP